MGFMDDARARVRGRRIRIVYPEGTEERAIRAAALLRDQDLAAPILVGPEHEVRRRAGDARRAAGRHRGARPLGGTVARGLRPRLPRAAPPQGRDRGAGRGDVRAPALPRRADGARRRRRRVRLRARQRHQAVPARLRGHQAARRGEARLVGLHHGVAGPRALLRRLLGEHRARSSAAGGDRPGHRGHRALVRHRAAGGVPVLLDPRQRGGGAGRSRAAGGGAGPRGGARPLRRRRAAVRRRGGAGGGGAEVPGQPPRRAGPTCSSSRT